MEPLLQVRRPHGRCVGRAPCSLLATRFARGRRTRRQRRQARRGRRLSAMGNRIRLLSSTHRSPVKGSTWPGLPMTNVSCGTSPKLMTGSGGELAGLAVKARPEAAAQRAFHAQASGHSRLQRMPLSERPRGPDLASGVCLIWRDAALRSAVDLIASRRLRQLERAPDVAVYAMCSMPSGRPTQVCIRSS